jgi:hypothetical protein
VVWWFRREHRGWSDKEVKCLTPPLTKKKHLAFAISNWVRGGYSMGKLKTSNYKKFRTDKVESGL